MVKFIIYYSKGKRIVVEAGNYINAINWFRKAHGNKEIIRVAFLINFGVK